jgi:hypothetical protein
MGKQGVFDYADSGRLGSTIIFLECLGVAIWVGVQENSPVSGFVAFCIATGLFMNKKSRGFVIWGVAGVCSYYTYWGVMSLSMLGQHKSEWAFVAAAVVFLVSAGLHLIGLEYLDGL